VPGTERRLLDTATLLAIGGAFLYVAARQYQQAYYGYFGLPSELQPAISSREAAVLALSGLVIPAVGWVLGSVSEWARQRQSTGEKRVRWLAEELGLYLFGAIAILIPTIYGTWSWRSLFDGVLFGTAVILLGHLLAREPWARRAASSPYALVVPWALFVLLTANPRGTAAAQSKTDFYTLQSQPNVVLISASTDDLVGVYLKSKNKLDTKTFVLKLEGGQAVTLVKKHLGRLHQ
jgi:hypothetical protein